MNVTHTQVLRLLKSIALSEVDQLDCDGCLDLIAEFAEAEMRGEDLSDSMRLVEIHLRQCPCCAYEYQALLDALMVTS